MNNSPNRDSYVFIDDQATCCDGNGSTSSDHESSSFATESSVSISSYSDDVSEEEEDWHKEVKPNGELFFVKPFTNCDTKDIKTNQLVNARRNVSDERIEMKKEKPERETSAPNWQNGLTTNDSVTKNVTSKMKTMTEIILTINDKRENSIHRSPTLERILGIIPGRLAIDDVHYNDETKSSVIVVQALVPSSQACINSSIAIGDWIVQVNESTVTWSNIDEVLMTLHQSQVKQVKLLFQRRSFEDQTANDTSSKHADAITCVRSELLFPKLLLGRDDKWKTLTTCLSSVPHGVLYLTMGTADSSDLNEDALYQFPCVANKLFPIRGALFTLSHLIPDISGSQPISSSVVIASRIVHVSYAREDREVFLLAMPGEYVTAHYLSELSSFVVQSLLYQYGSLHEAFATKSHRGNLDHLFTLLFINYTMEDHLLSSQFDDRPYMKFLGVPQCLPLANDLQLLVSDILSELESSDFADLSEHHYDMRRLYNIVGTVFFYRGFLVCNHLPSDRLKEIFFYLELVGLLETSRITQLDKVVIWREVHPRLSDDCDKDARWFLLIVGRNHLLLSALLEAGGCSSRAVGSRGPDPFYIDQLYTALTQLEVNHAPVTLDSWLQCPVAPTLVSAEAAAAAAASSQGRTLMRRGPSSKSIDKLVDQKAAKVLSSSKLSLGSLSSWHHVQPDVACTSSKKDAPATGDTDSDSLSWSLTASANSDDTTPILGRRGGRYSEHRSSWSDGDSPEGAATEPNVVQPGPCQRNLPSLLDLATLGDTPPSATRDRSVPLSKLTTGSENVLFHYVHLDLSEGVLVCPTQNFSCGEDLHLQVLKNFRASCLLIRHMLRLQTDQKESQSDSSRVEQQCVEHGLLFTVPTQSKGGTVQQRSLSYWTVGRLFLQPCPKEVYICYQDSCPQSVIELAFQLGFGLIT